VYVVSVFVASALPATPIDSLCECEHNNPDSLDARRLFLSVVLAVAPAVYMDEATSLLTTSPQAKHTELPLFLGFRGGSVSSDDGRFVKPGWWSLKRLEDNVKGADKWLANLLVEVRYR